MYSLIKLKCLNLKVSEPPSNKVYLAYFYLSDPNYLWHFTMRYSVVEIILVETVLVGDPLYAFKPSHETFQILTSLVVHSPWLQLPNSKNIFDVFQRQLLLFQICGALYLYLYFGTNFRGPTWYHFIVATYFSSNQDSEQSNYWFWTCQEEDLVCFLQFPPKQYIANSSHTA